MSKIVRFKPLAELSSLQRQFFGDDWLSPFKGMNIPTTDVYTTEKGMVVEAHLPNFELENIDIQIEDGVLVISAQRHEKEEHKDRKYVVKESSSSFHRQIAIPERAQEDGVKASLDDGVLKVLVPISPLPEPKRVTISSNSKKAQGQVDEKSQVSEASVEVSK
jgi:HSP20 family protein